MAIQKVSPYPRCDECDGNIDQAISVIFDHVGKYSLQGGPLLVTNGVISIYLIIGVISQFHPI